MDDIIQKLIEFDRQCVEKVELAKEKKSEEAQIKHDVAKIYNL
mgnify:CR=1 FL=1